MIYMSFALLSYNTLDYSLIMFLNRYEVNKILSDFTASPRPIQAGQPTETVSGRNRRKRSSCTQGWRQQRHET